MVKLAVNTALLEGIRKIRNTEYDEQDLLSLVDGTKTPASILDAYGALCQANSEIDEDTGVCFPHNAPVQEALLKICIPAQKALTV